MSVAIPTKRYNVCRKKNCRNTADARWRIWIRDFSMPIYASPHFACVFMVQHPAPPLNHHGYNLNHNPHTNPPPKELPNDCIFMEKNLRVSRTYRLTDRNLWGSYSVFYAKKVWPYEEIWCFHKRRERRVRTRRESWGDASTRQGRDRVRVSVCECLNVCVSAREWDKECMWEECGVHYGLEFKKTQIK